MISKRIPKFIWALTLLFVFACSKTEENVPLNTPTAQIAVDDLVRKASLRNQNIPFKIINEAGDDVTAVATFFVNGVEIDGQSFSSPDVGEFEVYGVYTENGVEITTNTETFNVIIPKRKIVVEDYTGTWCGFCPRVSGALYDLEELTDQIAVIAIHETANSFPDPMHFDQVQILKDAYNVEGFPAARINRSIDWPTPHETSLITSIAGVDTDLSIALNSEVNGDNLLVQVNVVYESGSGQGDKLVLYLIEDYIYYDQVNYYNYDSTSEFYNLGDPIPDFEHNHVLRESFTGVLGNTIPDTEALNEYITSFNFNIPSDYVKDNLKIVAMVVDSNNTAKNAQYAELNENKAYQ